MPTVTKRPAANTKRSGPQLKPVSQWKTEITELMESVEAKEAAKYVDGYEAGVIVTKEAGYKEKVATEQAKYEEGHAAGIIAGRGLGYNEGFDLGYKQATAEVWEDVKKLKVKWIAEARRDQILQMQRR
jgi:flagellar biosynthesis/type III secretory pathway protein FliH